MGAPISYDRTRALSNNIMFLLPGNSEDFCSGDVVLIHDLKYILCTPIDNPRPY